MCALSSCLPPQVGATLTDDPAEEAAQKQLKSLLNKITKDNFAKITAQVGWCLTGWQVKCSALCCRGCRHRQAQQQPCLVGHLPSLAWPDPGLLPFCPRYR